MGTMDLPELKSESVRSEEVDSRLTRLLNPVHNLVEMVSMLLLFMMIAVTVYQVFMRSVLRSPTSWSEEIALLFMIWFGYLGMVLGVRDDVHISVEFFFYKLPKPIQLVFDVIDHLLLMLFSYFMLIEGIRLFQIAQLQRFPAIRISRSWMYAVMVVSGALMFLYIGERLLIIRKRFLVSHARARKQA